MQSEQIIQGISAVPTGKNNSEQITKRGEEDVKTENAAGALQKRSTEPL